MSKECDPFTLPPSPKGLCFDKNQFLGNNFSVDGFLHDHRNAGSLETMRDDLGVYLKVLRSAMIELINKDYADFVNLSANLIGLDREINNIQAPLGQLREEVLHVKECLSDAMKELSGRLEQRRLLRERKRSLQYLSQAQSSLKKLTTILFIENKPKENITSELIERASSEYNRLQFTITKCDCYVSTEQRDLSNKIGQILKTTLGEMFLKNLNLKNIDKTQRCLQIFSTLDRVSDVEILLRKEVIAPAMHQIISESALQRNPAGLKGVLSNILLFIDEKLKDLLSITLRTKKSSNIDGYNFLLNSFWPEVEYRIEVHMSSIFAPGTPELFYSRYNESLEFLRKFSKYFDSQKAVESFYNHPQYESFQNRWNLSVYFHVRFLEIAGSFETVLLEPINNKCILNEVDDAKNDFNLKASSVCWSSLMMCWTQGVFILALSDRFWKLSLLILSRYSTWINDALKQKWPTDQAHRNPHSDKFNGERLKFLIFLYVDVKRMINELPTFLEMVKKQLHPVKRLEALDRSLSDSQTSLSSRLPQIKKMVILETSAESIVNLKQLEDIPRLFRKTNRDIPTKACGYVATLIKSPQEFNRLYKDHIGEGDTVEWLEGIFSIITTRYYVGVNNVLTSVYKTEESLRRLKQMRDRSVQSNLEKSGISDDDDKIRIQLKVDVKTYSDHMVNFKVNKDNVEKLQDLLDLVEKAASSKPVS